MSRDNVAGFMMGISAGVVIGYFLKPPDEKTDPNGDVADAAFKQRSERASGPLSSSLEPAASIRPTA
jgi:hypothetical protein